MKHFIQICTLLTIIFSAHFIQAQCPVPASAVAFTASPSATSCAQTDITFTITSPDPNYTYTWDFDDASSGSNNAIGTVVTHSFSANNAGGSHNVTVTATPSSGTVQPVVWTNLNSGITANGNSLIRSSNSGWNAGAESTQSINDNMYVEYIAGMTDNRLMCGFGLGNTSSRTFSTVDYALYTRFDGQVLVYESGSWQGTFGTYSYGDTMRVAAENGVVNYYQNGNLLYTSSNTPSFPMFVDASINHTNDTLHNVVIGSSCTGTNSMTINTNATPEIDVTGTWDRCIAVDNLGFTNTLFQINNYDPTLTYTWDFGDGGGPTVLIGNIQTHTYNSHGVYDVTITTTNGSCVGTYTNQVLYLERPLADMVIVGTADICEGDTIYVANNTDTTSIDYFVLDWGDGTRDTTSSTDTLSHVYNFSDVFACTISQGGEPYTITLYAVNACFEHTNSSPITVTATPRTDFSAPDIVCETINATGGVNFTAATCPAPTDIFSDLNNYIWDFGDPTSASNTSTFSSPTHVFSGPGDYEVTVQLISNCGTFYDTMNVIILENPNAGFSFNVNNPPSNTINGDGCAPIEVQFTNSSTGDSVTYNWMVQTNVIGGANFINGTTDTSINPQMEFTLPGDYIVTLSATNQCTTTTFVDTITVLDGPTVTINPPSPTCDVFLYTPDVVYGGGGGAILTYNWSFPGAIPATSNSANPTNILYFSSGTYQAVVEITNECTVVRDTVSFYVPITPTPVTLSANGNQNTCLNSAAFNLSADSTGGFWSGNGITDPNLGTFNPLLAGVGTHTITYTYNPRVCPSVTTIDIVVNALPTVSASGDTTLCISDGNMTLGGESPAGGTWSGVGIIDANLGIFDPTNSGAGVFPVTYTFTDGNGCTNTDSRDVRVFGLPVLNLGGDKTECNGPDDIPLLAAPSGGTWSGTGINSTNSTFNAVAAGGLGIYKAYYDYTDGNGCENRDSVNINVVNGVTADAGTDTSLCEAGSPITLSNGVPTGGVWQGTGVFNSGGDYLFYPSISGTGSHNVIYSVGTGSCEELDTMVVTVIPIPAVNADTDTSVCVNSPAFDMTGFTPSGGTWSGTGLTGISFDPSIGVGTYNLTYSYTDPVTQCENTDIRVVTVNAIPNVIASPAATECNTNSDIQLTGFSPGGGTWTGAGITNSTFGTFNPNTAGGLSFDGSDTTYNLTYTYTDFNGCIDDALTTITVTFGDTVEAGPDDTLCINSGSFALSGFTPIAGGSWSGSGVAGFNFFPSAAGLGTHTLTYTYGTGSCLKTDTKTILVLDIPAVNAGNDTLICENTSPIQLVPFSPVGGVWTGSGVSGDTFDPDATGDGTFILTYTYTDPTSGCSNTDTKTITVSPLPNVTTNGADIYCFNTSDITLTNYNPAGGTWSGAGITDVNNGIFNGSTAGGLGFNDADTLYPVIYSYTDNNGCSNSDTLDITITDGIDAFAGVDDTICQYDPTFIINGFSPAGGTWSGSGIVNANTGQFDPSTVSPGTYNLVYTIGSGTCQDTDTMTILIVPTPVVEAGNNIEICADSSAFILTGFSPAGGIWSGTGITDVNTGIFDPSISGVGTFTITYTYTEPINGCENSDTRTITINSLPSITMPDTLMYCNSGGDITISGYTPTGGIWSGQGITDANAGIFNTMVAGGLGFNDADTSYQLLYIYTDANGCIDSSDLTLMLILGDTIDAGPDLAMCVTDAPVTFTGFTPSSGGTWSGAGIVNASLGTFDPSIGAGNYTVTYTHGNGTCLKTDTRDILVGGVPTVIAGNDIDYCITEPQDTLTGFSPSGGVWSGTGITDTTNGYFHPDTAGVGSFLITYTFTNSITGCENSDTRILDVNGLPIVNAGDTVRYCDNPDNIVLSGYSPIGGTWSGAGIIDATNGIFNTIVAGGIGVNNADTTYPVIYTVTSGDGCVDSDTLSIIVEFGDTVVAGGPYGVCIDDGLVTLSGYSPLGGTWSGAGIIDGVNGIFDPTAVTSNTLIDIVYTVGSGTCQKSDSTTIFVGIIPSVEAGANDTICSADPALTLSNYVPSTGGVWSGTGITDATNGIFDPSVAGVGTWTLTYTYTNTFTGCENSDTKLMTVRPAPTVSAGNDRVECNNSTDIILSGYSPLGGIWSGPGIIDANNGIFNSIIAGGVGPNNTPAIYTLTYTYTDGIGCTNSDVMQFTVEFGDTVDAGAGFNICEDAGLQTLVGSPAGGTWSGTGVIDPSGIFDPTVPTPGAFYTLTYTFGTGSCQKTDDIQVFVSPEITVDAGNDITVCLTSSPFNLSGNSPSSGGTWSGVGITDANAGTFDAATAGLGNHIITFDYVNTVTGCQGSDTRVVSVVDVPVAEAGAPVTYCNNANNITLSGYSPLGGTWSGSGIVDGINGIFNTVSAGGLGFNNADTTYQVVYTYSSGSNCSDTDTLEITVEFGEIVNAGLDDTTCIDDGQLTLVGSPVGGTWSGLGIIDPFAGIFDPTVSGAGLITLTYTHGTGSCEKSDDLTILVGALPIINPGADDVICIDNGILTLSGYSPQGGIWSGTGIVDGNAGTFDPAIGVGTYTLTYVYANPLTGCDSSVTKTVTVNPLPSVNASDVTFCDNINDISLNGLGAPNNGTWSGVGVVDANGLFNSNIAGGLGYNGGDTIYTLTYTFTDVNGCVNSDDMDVTVTYGDTVEAGPDLAMCVTEGLINMADYGPLGGTWSGNGIIDANNGTFDPTQVTAGFHTLTYTFGAGSCLKTDTRTIYVDTIPTVTAGPDISVCQQADSITISTGSPGGGYWLGVGVDSTGGFTPQNMSVGTFNLAYTYVNTTTGCQNTDTLAITVDAPPVVDAGTDDIYCNTNQNITLSGQTPATGGLWNGPGIIDGINGIFNTQTAGGLGYNDADTTYQVVYTFTDNNGCFNRDTLDITVEFGDLVDAGLPDTICIDNGQFVLGGYTPLGGTWSGTGVVDPNLGIFDPTISGTGTHTLTYTSGVGTCQKSDSKTIFVDALPIVSAGVDQTICIDNGILTLSGYTPQGGVWGGTGIIDPNLGTFDPSVSNLGTFTLTYTFTNPITGCSETDIKLVEVAPLPNVTAGGTVTYCNTPNQITISDYTTFSPNGGVWSGPGVVDANNGIFSTVIAGGLASDGSDTTYNLTYTYTDGNGCVNSDILGVTVTFGDTVVAGNNQSICIDAGLVVLTDFSPSNGTWSGPGITDPAGIFDPTAAGFGTHTLTYTFGSGTCQKNATKTIFVGQPPVISAGVDETVCVDNGLIPMQGFSPFGGVWTGTSVDSNGIFDPSIGVGSYTLTYTFINSVTGCEASDTKMVIVAPLPTVTTANTALYCDIASNITLTGYTPSGGIWTGSGIVDGNLGLFNTTQAGGLATNGADTTYTLIYTYTDGNGCINSNTTDVTVTFGDTVVAGTNEATCFDAGLLNLTGFSPAGGTFSGTGIIDPIAGVFDPALAGGGTHVITYTFGSGTCEKESTKTIFVGTDPIVEAGPDLERCIDEGLFQLTNYSPLGGTWSGVGVTDATNGFFDPAVAGDGTWTLTYSFTNSITGCEASDTRVVTIHPLPIVTAPDSLEFCNTTTNITLSGYAPLGGTWIGTGIVDQNNGVFNTTIAGGVGVYDIEYRYTDVNGCTNNDSTVINVIFGDTVEAGPDLAVCISDAPLLLTGFQPVGGTWTGNGITDPSGVFDPQVAGSGLHTITISYGIGTCLKTDSRDIFVGDIPNVIAGADDAVCGQDADYMLTGFSPPGGYWLGNGVDSAGLFSPVGATPGTWILTYTYVNPITGCENSDTKEVFVETPPAVDAGGTVTYCNSTNNITLNQHTPTGGVWSGAGIVDGLNGIFNTTAAGGLAHDGSDTTYFLFYEFTSGTGCFGRDTLDVIVTFGDTVYAGVDDTICIDGGQLNLTGFSPAGGTWSGNGVIDNVLGIFDPATAGVGLHTLSYTYGVGTCEKTDIKTVFVGALPVINPGIDELVCINEATFTLSNFSPQGGYWVGVGVDSSGVFDPATAGVGTWTLTYTFTNSITGCDNSETKEITVAPLPTVVVPDSIEYCDNPNDITLSGYSPSGGSWSGVGIVSANAGIFSTVLAGGLGTNGADTTYPVIYTFTDINGCTNRDTMNINVIFGDTVDAGPDMSICISDGLITLAGYTPPSGGSWSGTGVIDANAGIFDPNLAGGGTHVLTYTYGIGTCEKTDTRTIFVGTIPTVDAGPDILVCEDQTAFTLNSFSPTGGVWSGTGITDSINAVFDPQVTGTGTFILVYDYENTVTGCENFDTREITVAPLPVVDVDDSLEFCINNNNIPLTDYVSTTPTTGLTWSGSGIVDPTDGVFNATIAGGIGQYAVVINYTDVNGCSNNDTLVIDVIFGDTVEAGPDDTLCINDNPILLTGFSPIGGTFSGAGVDAVSGTFDPVTAGAGLHIITYTFGTGTCEKTDTRTILVGNLPSINIGPDQTVCIDGGAFTLSAYSPQGGTWAGVGITDPNVGIFNIDSAGVGTHILTYTFANSITGCENTAQRTITVAPLPVVDAGNPILICDNPDDYTIPTSSYSPNGGTWSGQGIVNASAGVFNTVIAGGLGFNNADTIYPVIYTFTDGNSCTNFDTLDITVQFGDSILAGPNEALCIDIGLHQLTGFLPSTNGLWTGNGISDPINGIFDPQAAGPGAHTLTISTGTGTCAKSDDKIIFVGTPPAVNPGNDQAVCADDTSFAFTGFSPPGGIWSGVGITDSVNAVFDPQVSGTGTFVLTYTFVNSVTNCETVATKQVTVNPLPFVDAGDTVTYCDNPNDIVLSGYTPSSGGFWSGPGVINPSQGIFNTGQAGGIGVYELIFDYTEPFTGCENRDTLVVDVIFGDTVLAGPNDTLCIQDLPINLQGSPAGGTWTGTGITNGNLGTFNPAIAEGGTHVMTYTYGVGTCEKTDTKIIFVGEPDPLDAGNDQILCVDAPPINLTASLPDGVWSGNGITNTMTGEFNAGVALVGLHNIVYTYTNAVTGCVSMDTLVIEVKPLPVVNTAGAITYCEWPLNVQLPTPNLTPGVWSGAGIVDINNGIFNGIVAGGLGANGVDTLYPITYTHTDAFGCSNSDILNITITYGDSVLAGPDITACVDDNPITLVGTPVGGVWSGFGITDPTGVFDPAVGIGGGNFDVIYTQGAGTCEKSDTLTITIIDVTGTTAGADEEFCYEDGLVTLTGNSPLGGVWTGPGIQDGNLGTFLTQAVSTGVNPDTVQVCYTYVDALSGCDYTDCKNVIVRPLPVVGFTAVDTACVNDVITFTNTSVDAISFQWYFGDGDSSIFLTPTHVYDTSGLYTVMLIAYSDYGCPDTTTQDILIYEIPQAGFAMNTNDGCGPLTVGFTNTTTNQDQNLTYSWDFGNGLTSSQANPPSQTYNAGVEDTVYVVSLTVNNLCGTTTFTDSIIVRAQPEVIFVADDNYGCGPLVVNFSNASTGGPNSYLWTFGPFGSSTDTIPPPVSFTITDTVAVTYYVVLTATNGCGTDIDSIPITVIPGSVNAGIGTSVTEGCEPLTVDFTSAVQMGDNVQWIFGDGNGSVLDNPTHVFDTVGTFTVLQIVTNQCGSDTATIDITVHPQPPMSISHDPFVCVGQPMQFYNNSNPISGTVWAFGDGDSSVLTNPAHVYTTPGIYTVYVTNYSITHLCPITDSTVVEVKDIPNASFAIDDMDGCSPLTVNFTNNSTGIFNSWMFINGVGTDTAFTIVQSPTHTFTEPGQHYVVLRTSDQFGCFEDTTITGIVVHPDPVAAFTPNVDQQCGLDALVTLNNNSTDADAYFWDFGNGTFSNVTSPTISYNNVGDHTIFLEASNIFGCRDTLIDEITVYPSPNADFDLQPQTGCEPLTVQFLQLATNTNGYFWDFGNGETSTEANPIHTYSAGAYNVTFVASIDDLCFDTIVIADAVFAEGSPIADFEILQSDPDNPTGVIDFVNNTIGATQYEWEFGDGTFSNEENPSKEYLENGQRIVRLIAWNDQGCSDTLIKVVEPIGFKGLFVPNAFSPDAGIGDVRLFKPVGVSIATYKAQVFSQWGELLWESEALDDAGRPTEAWDGMYKGTQMPQGAYVWKVEAVFIDGSIWEGQKNTLGQTKKIGSVTLLR